MPASSSSSSSIDGFHRLHVAADVDQKVTRVLFVKSDNSLPEDEEWIDRTLFVTHMAGLGETHIHDVFGNFGEIERVTIKQMERRELPYLKKEGIKQEFVFALVRFLSADSLQQVFAKCEESEKVPVLVESLATITKASNILKHSILHLKRSYYPDAAKLQRYYDSFSLKYENRLKAEKEEQTRRETEVDEDGFILVGASNFKKRSFRPQDESDGNVRQKMGQLLGLEDSGLNVDDKEVKKARKKAKKTLSNFYSTQRKENRLKEMLEEDKQGEREEYFLKKMKKRKIDM